MLEDKLLIWKFNRGDRGALRGVYEKYKDNLVTLAAALLTDVSSAEDVVHDVFLRFARDATLGRKQMKLIHTEIFPGTYASTTETADYLLEELKLRRTPVLKWGPMGSQQLSEVSKGQFLLKGYAGNSAPDHVDQLHALGEHLKCIEWEAP